MRRHLVIHFSGSQALRVTNPVYRCSLCTFRSKWQFFVKKHITTHHLSVRNAYVLKYNSKVANNKSHNHTPIHQENDTDTCDQLPTDLQMIENQIPVEASSLDAVNNEPYMHSDTNEIEDEQDENKRIETVTLTDQNGQQFAASYHVIGGPVDNAKLENSPICGRKRASSFVCVQCPYSTKVHSNLKQHLHGHRAQAECVKCRYCTFYVGHQRLLRQHEMLHSEFEELPEHTALKRNSSVCEKAAPIQV